MDTIQVYNQEANKLVEDLRSFFQLESSGLNGLIAGSRKNNKGFIEPTLNFRENKNWPKLIQRIKDFYFPIPSAECVLAFFNDIKKVRTIVSANNPGYEIDNPSIEILFNATKNYLNEKGFKARVVMGSNFVRVQGKEMAITAMNFLKNKFKEDFYFERIHEDMFPFTKSKNSENLGQKNEPVVTKTGNSLVDKLIRVMDVFGIGITGSDTDDGKIILGFNTQSEVDDAWLYCDDCGIVSEVNGTTLVFSENLELSDLENIKQKFKSISASSNGNTTYPVQTRKSEKPVSIGKPFFEEVRYYYKSLGYELYNNQSLRRAGDTEYVVGFKQDSDLDSLIKQALVDKPYWILERSQSGKRNWITFKVKGVAESKIQQPESEEVKSQPQIIANDQGNTHTGIKLNFFLEESHLKYILKNISDERLLVEVEKRSDIMQKLFSKAITALKKKK